MNILFITHFFVGFMVSEIPRVSVFGHWRIRLLSPTLNYIYFAIDFLFVDFILECFFFIYIFQYYYINNKRYYYYNTNIIQL